MFFNTLLVVQLLLVAFLGYDLIKRSYYNYKAKRRLQYKDKCRAPNGTVLPEGITWNKSRGRYEVKKQVRGQMRYGGMHKSYIEAEEALRRLHKNLEKGI